MENGKIIFFFLIFFSEGVSIQPFQTPPMSRPRFHSHTESSSGTCLNNTFNLLPVKDTNGRKSSSKMVIDEDDIIPVKQEPSAITATPKSTTATAADSATTTNDKDVIIMATTDNLAPADERFKSIIFLNLNNFRFKFILS